MSETHQGFIFAGMAVIFWGLWGFFSKVATGHNDPAMVAVISNAFLGLTAPALYFFARQQGTTVNLSGMGLWSALASALGAFFGGLVYLYALKKAPATVVVPLTAAYPAVTSFLAVVFLKESMDAKQMVGMGLIMGGCILLGLPKS